MSIIDCNNPLARNIAHIIEERALRQHIVAERAGLGKQAFNDMLKGRRLIKAHDIPFIASALGVSPNDLFGITHGEKSA